MMFTYLYTAGTHYEANTEMDWEPHHPVARSSSLFPRSNNNNSDNIGGTGRQTTSNAHSRAFLSSASSTSPFLFHTSAMQLDEPTPTKESPPVASTSSSSSKIPDHNQTQEDTIIQSRDIANGAVQRERRKRDQLKVWQAAKGKGVQIEEDNEEAEEDESVDEVETSFMESLSLSAPIKGLLVSKCTISSSERVPSEDWDFGIVSDGQDQADGVANTRQCTSVCTTTTTIGR